MIVSKLNSLGPMVLIGSIAMLSQAHGEDMTDPIDILKKADAAAQSIQFVRYETEFHGVGNSQAQTPRIKGKFLTMGIQNNRPEKFKADLEVNMTESEKTKRLTVGGNGEEFYVLDHDNKKAYVDIDPAVTGSAGRALFFAMVPEYGHKTPFSDEINGKKQELRGACEVSGEAGYEVYVAYASGAQEAVWCFSKKTFLPRRRLDTFTLRTGETRSRLRTITKLEVLDRVDDAAFNVVVPEGYERIDDFYE